MSRAQLAVVVVSAVLAAVSVPLLALALSMVSLVVSLFALLRVSDALDGLSQQTEAQGQVISDVTPPSAPDDA